MFMCHLTEYTVPLPIGWEVMMSGLDVDPDDPPPELEHPVPRTAANSAQHAKLLLMRTSLS
jgi:hypothetical protein